MGKRYKIEGIHHVTGRGQVVVVPAEAYKEFKLDSDVWVFHKDHGVKLYIRGVEAMRGIGGQVTGPIGLLLRGVNLTEEFKENCTQLTIEKI